MNARRRSGLSLLEVLLAIAILGGALVVLSELVRIGARSSREARELTVAQLLCEAKLAELELAGTAPQTATKQPCETNPDWVYSVEVQPSDLEGLMYVMVRVEEAAPASPRPLEFTLARWLLDPSLEADALAAEAAAADPASTSNSSTTGGS